MSDRRVEGVRLREGQSLRPQEVYLRRGVHAACRDGVLLRNRERTGRRVEVPLERGGRLRRQAVHHQHRLGEGLAQIDRAREVRHVAVLVAVAQHARHHVELGRGAERGDRAGVPEVVPQLRDAARGHAVAALRVPHPVAVERAAVAVALAGMDEQPLAERVEVEGVVRVVAVRDRAEARRALEEHLHVVRGGEERLVHRREAHPAEELRLRHVHGRTRRRRRLRCARERHVGGDSWKLAARGHLRIPLPIRVTGVRRQHAHLLGEHLRPRPVGAVREAGSLPAGDFLIKDVVAGVGVVRLLERVHAEVDPHHVAPAHEPPGVAVPVARALLPAAVVVAPHRIDAGVRVEDVLQPRARLGDLAVERHGALAEEMPGALGVARERRPEDARVEMAEHFLSARADHAAARRALLLGEQVVEEGVRARHVHVVRHAGLVVEAVAGRALGIPRQDLHQDLPRERAARLVAVEPPTERKLAHCLREAHHAYVVGSPLAFPRLRMRGA